MTSNIHDHFNPSLYQSYREPLEEKEEKKEGKRREPQEEIAVSTASLDLFSSIHERRCQENPHLRETTYELVQGLYQEGIQVDLPMAGKVITALEILQTDYLFGQPLNLKDERQGKTLQLLLDLQQQVDPTHLQKYDSLTVEDARKRLENFKHKPHENFKKLARESALVDGILSIPGAGPFLKEALNQYTKPREDSAIGLSDLREQGCFEKDGQIISVENLGPTAGCKLDPSGGKALDEAYAEHITRLYGNQEEVVVVVGMLQKENEILKKEVTKNSENLEKASTETAKKEKEAGWNKTITRSFVCVANAAQAFNDNWDRMQDAEYIDKAKTREFLKAAKRTQEILDRDSQSVTSLINTRTLLENTQQNQDSITKIETLLGEIEGFIEQRSKIASIGDGQVEHLKAINEKIKDSYVRLKKEQQKIRERFGYISLATRVIGAGLAAFPGTQIVGAAVTIVGEGIHAIGSHVDKGFRDKEDHYTNLSASYYNISSELGAVVQKNSINLHHLEDQRDYLTNFLLTHLQRDPNDHVRYMTYLENTGLEKRGKLGEVALNITQQQQLLGQKEGAVTAATKYLADKRRMLADAEWNGKSEENIKEKKEKVEKAQEKLDEAKKELLAQKEVMQGLQEEQTSLTTQNQDIEKELENAKRTQNIQEKHAEYLRSYNFLVDLLGASEDRAIEKAHQNMSEIAQLNQQGRQLIETILSRTNHLAYAIDDCFDTRISEKLQTPSIVISKSTTVISGLIQLTHAYGTVQAFLQDREKEHQEALLENPESQRKPIDPMQLIRFGAKFIDPTSTVLIAGLELFSLFKDQGQIEPSEMQKMIRELSDLRSNVRQGISKMHEHLGVVHQDVVERFESVAKRLDLFEASITHQLESLGDRLEMVSYNQTRILNFRKSREDMRSFHANELSLHCPYRIYVVENEYNIPVNQLLRLFAVLRSKTEQMHHRDNTGVWLREFDTSTQLILASSEPQHCTGLLSEQMKLGPLPNFYQYEHYSHIFSRLGAKVLLDENHPQFKQEVAAFSNELLVQGTAIERFFSPQLISSVLMQYAQSRKALVESLKNQQVSIHRASDTRLVEAYQGWMESSRALTHYQPQPNQGRLAFFRPQNRRSLMNSKRFSFLQHIHRPIATRGIQEIAHKKIYLEMLYQSHANTWSDSSFSFLSNIPVSPFGGAGEAIGHKGDYVAYCNRMEELPELIRGAQRIQQLSLMQLFSSENIKIINAQQRGAIAGNFIEIAYRIESGLRRYVRLCNNSATLTWNVHGQNKTHDVSNPLHRNVTFPDCLSPKSWDLNRALQRTREMASKSFSELFVFSVVQTYTNQNGSKLSGKTFLVLSDYLNKEGILTRMLKVPQLIESQAHFDLTGKKYVKMATSPDGACALHALLGEYQDGYYHYGNRAEELRGNQRGAAVRKHFADTLKDKIAEPNVEKILVGVLKAHLNNAVNRPGDDLSSTMLFELDSETQEIFSLEQIKELVDSNNFLASYSIISNDEMVKEIFLPLIAELGENRASIKKGWSALSNYYKNISSVLKRKEAELWIKYTTNDRFMAKVMHEVAQLEVREKAAVAKEDEESALKIRSKPFYQKTKEEVIKMSTENPMLLMKLIDGIAEECIKIARSIDPERGYNLRPDAPIPHILRIHQYQKRLQAERTEAERRFVLSKPVMDRYLEIIQKVRVVVKGSHQPNFFFNFDEINLAAVLFNKKVQIVVNQEGEIKAHSDYFYNRTIQGDPIVIYYAGNHFERCVNLSGLPQGNLTPIAERDRNFKKDYNASVNNLVKSYVEFLEVHQNEKGIPEGSENPFLKEKKFPPFKILTPLADDKAHLPLAFPKAFLDRIEKESSIGSLRRVDIDGGIVTPYYSFTLNNEAKCYELRIEYRLEGSNHPQPLPEEYCSVVVAQIGRDTVDAFRDQQQGGYGDPEEASQFFHNEFLVQAMYTDFADEGQRTLPGKLSFRLLQTEAESVIPIDEPFAGLFNKFVEVSKPKKSFTKALFNHKHPRLNERELMIYNPATISLTPSNKGFYLIEKARLLKTEQHKKAIRDHLEQYHQAQKDYLLLESLLKLTLNESARIEAMRRIHSPDTVIARSDITDTIYADHFPREEQEKDGYQKDQYALQLINDVLESYAANPSTERLRLNSHLKNLKAIKSYAEDERKEAHTQLLEIAAQGKAKPFSDYGS